jgi:ATP-dependent DNA ligase
MAFIIKPPLPPMEARSADEIPVSDKWQYEPKWDGFRCISFRDGEKIYLQSKAGQPLARYFPDIVDALATLPARHFVLDGELAIPIGGRLSFNELQLRLHPARQPRAETRQSQSGDVHHFRSTRSRSTIVFETASK